MLVEDRERTPVKGNLTLALTTPPRALVAGSLRDSVCSSRLNLAPLVGKNTDFV